MTTHGKATYGAESNPSFTPLERLLDTVIDRWHESSDERPLHEWLGLTWDEYAAYVDSGVEALVKP